MDRGIAVSGGPDIMVSSSWYLQRRPSGTVVKRHVYLAAAITEAGDRRTSWRRSRGILSPCPPGTVGANFWRTSDEDPLPERVRW